MSAIRFPTVQLPEPPDDIDVTRRVDASVPGAPHLGRRWYIGPLVAVFWLAALLSSYLHGPTSLWMNVLAVAGGVAYGVGIVAAVPVAWRLPRSHRLWASVALFALSFVLWPILGWAVGQTWVFVGIVIGLSLFTMRVTYLLTGTLVGMALVFELAGGATVSGGVWMPAIIASITMMVTGFARQNATIRTLHATRLELAALEVQKERGRVARDMHDILGHSLTAIAVKAELAGMLIDTDARQQARAEVTALEDLARGALADVRSTVAGYRGVNVVGELANARSILASAGIEAQLPSTVDELAAADRELAGWVVREGVTNVMRHSRASLCRVTVRANLVEVDDNGHGAPNDGADDGNGLRGLRERAEAAGWRLKTGSSDLGGFRLTLVRGDAA
ncbi:sensor histidine kinase [Humibacter sp. RRB41]|uniref:sensor histidine kinase n=1 Tax=Humibacter sp. RRB41 TaxID=2919946 RepID=UPI001FAAB66C|nr:sensor histidine kinase [Humibacter sp. RRB41]